MKGLSDFERQRIEEVAKAVGADDFARFRFLSDEPFINEEAARENFVDARLKAVSDPVDWEAFSDIGEDDQGNRIIHIRVQNLETGRRSIFLTLCSNSNRIAIWAFADNPFYVD
jgi:hypothetical protein